MRFLAIASLFEFHWMLNTFTLIGDCIQCFGMSHWFFERRKETVVIPVGKITKMMIYNHLGAIILLAIGKIFFKPIRLFLTNLRRVLRTAKQYSNVVRFFQACCLVCIHSNERFFRYISKNLLVQMSIWGEDFKKSA
mmetsp:Transcript_11443/g.9848  ORF Transcript_11443/g.9848 Transcript_11443/m.9848 type:complete len:137 (-) Transcript_11443:1142-1552(-)